MTAVVFDFGGVLLRWQPAQLIRDLLPQRAPDDDSARQVAGQIFQSYGGDWAEFDRGTLEPPALLERLAARTGLPAAEVQRVVDAVPHALQPLPDTVALMERLHAAGHTLFYLSNMPRPYADFLLATHGFLGRFRDGVFSGRVGHNKPEREIFEIASARFGRMPGELLFIDDHAPNVAAAQALGWQSFVFEGAAAAEAEFTRRGLLPGG
ncbi:MAG: HAD family phosphatase [Rubrivivax sp.]|nr:HAD family phosphatase [Rubrivivax sp.]